MEIGGIYLLDMDQAYCVYTIRQNLQCVDGILTFNDYVYLTD